MTPFHRHYSYLTELRQMLEGIAGMDISLWNADGLPLVRPDEDSPGMHASPRAGEWKWVVKPVQAALMRNEHVVTEAPRGGFYFFIPMVLDDVPFVIAGGEPPASGADSGGSSCSGRKSETEVGQIACNVDRLFRLYAQLQQEGSACSGKLMRAKTVLRLLAHMKEQSSPEDLCSVFSDVVLYLYSVHTLAFVSGEGGRLRPLMSAGQLRDAVGGTLHFDEAAWMVHKAMRDHAPLFFDNPLDLRCLGLDRRVTSMHLFPVAAEGDRSLLLCIFNTPLACDDAREILDLCRYMRSFISSMSRHESFDSTVRDMTILNFATAGLLDLFDRPEVMYHSIVDTAVRLTGAEKCSLLLADTNREELSLKAAQGINAGIFEQVRIRAGEGIAGRVFSESVPIISRDIEKDFSVRKKPSYRTPSFMSIPLKVGDETIGVLNISDKISGEVFNTEDLAFIRHFVHYASIAIHGAGYYSLAEQYKELSITDHLTGLYNRRYFQDRLSEEIDRSERHQLRFSLAIIDIDDFKIYNDTEGHLAGDDILRRLTQIIKDSLRAIDVFARIGGEEFAVVMPQTDKEEALGVAERVRQAVSQKMALSRKSYPGNCLTVSIGIASFPADDTLSRRLFWKADKALYQAKLLGKNRVCAWDGAGGPDAPDF